MGGFRGREGDNRCLVDPVAAVSIGHTRQHPRGGGDGADASIGQRVETRTLKQDAVDRYRRHALHNATSSAAFALGGESDMRSLTARCAVGPIFSSPNKTFLSSQSSFRSMNPRSSLGPLQGYLDEKGTWSIMLWSLLWALGSGRRGFPLISPSSPNYVHVTISIRRLFFTLFINFFFVIFLERTVFSGFTEERFY